MRNKCNDELVRGERRIMFELKNKRLSVLSEMVRPCEVAADIGTDHAHLPIELVLSGKCERVIACDVKEGPLAVAKKNISQYALGHCIELRLGFGLEVLEPGECSLITVAGMGGLMICDILERSENVARTASQLILQPNTCEYDLRKYLYENGYVIEDEKGVRDGDHCYLAVSCHKEENPEKLDEYKKKIKENFPGNNIDNYFFAGNVMAERKDDEDVEFLKNLCKKAERVLDGISLSGEVLTEENSEKKKKYTALCEFLRRISG